LEHGEWGREKGTRIGTQPGTLNLKLETIVIEFSIYFKLKIRLYEFYT